MVCSLYGKHYKQEFFFFFLQLVISSPLIHALGDLNQAHTGIRTRVPQIERQMTYQLSYPSPLKNDNDLFPPSICSGLSIIWQTL